MTESARRQADARRRWLRASLLLAMTAGSGVLAQGTAQQVVRVGFIANYEPFSFLGKDQRLTGFDVDVVRVLLESLGMTMQAEFGRFEQLRAKAQAGELDLVGNQLLLLPENRRWFDFVRPYANMQLVCVQHEDDERDFLSLDDFLGKRLGVLRHTGMEEQARGALGNGVVAFDRLGQALAALRDRKVDAVLEESLIAEYQIERDDLPLKLGAPMTAAYKVGLGVTKGNKALQSALSEGVAVLLKRPEFRQISRRWFGHDVSKPRVSHVSASID